MVTLTRRYALAISCCLAAATAMAGANEPPQPLELKFRDFFASPIGPRGLEIGPALKAAHGRRVRLTGYMVAQEEPPAGHFLLTPLPVRLSEHADGDADDLPPATVVVEMPASDKLRVLPHTPGLLQLTGVLQVGRHQLADGRVTWVRLQLDPKT